MRSCRLKYERYCIPSTEDLYGSYSITYHDRGGGLSNTTRSSYRVEGHEVCQALRLLHRTVSPPSSFISMWKASQKERSSHEIPSNFESLFSPQTEQQYQASSPRRPAWSNIVSQISIPFPRHINCPLSMMRRINVFYAYLLLPYQPASWCSSRQSS